MLIFKSIWFSAELQLQPVTSFSPSISLYTAAFVQSAAAAPSRWSSEQILAHAGPFSHLLLSTASLMCGLYLNSMCALDLHPICVAWDHQRRCVLSSLVRLSWTVVVDAFGAVVSKTQRLGEKSFTAHSSEQHTQILPQKSWFLYCGAAATNRSSNISRPIKYVTTILINNQ